MIGLLSFRLVSCCAAVLVGFSGARFCTSLAGLEPLSECPVSFFRGHCGAFAHIVVAPAVEALHVRRYGFRVRGMPCLPVLPVLAVLPRLISAVPLLPVCASAAPIALVASVVCVCFLVPSVVVVVPAILPVVSPVLPSLPRVACAVRDRQAQAMGMVKGAGHAH